MPIDACLRAAALVAGLLLAAAAAPSGRAADLTDDQIAAYSMATVFAEGAALENSLAALAARGDPDIAAALILGLRYQGAGQARVAEAFGAITGSDARDWFTAMLWQQAHPEVRPHASYRRLKLAVLQAIDPAFMRFFQGTGAAPDRLRIRLEEITWGGVRVDGIPSLDFPKRIPVREADYLRDDDLVFGVAINSDARAYPLRIMGWHEMFNEVIGGVPVALAYCTLCGAGILFETLVEPRREAFVFGSSGLLYRSNKLMFDRQTDSLWNQFTGQPVAGPLADSGIVLKLRPVAITSWADWRARHPDTSVLSLDTGHRRDYGSGVVYRDYFASPALMFPALVGDERAVRRKGFVFGIRTAGAARAWPLSVFAGGRVINDRLGGLDVVLVGRAETRTVRAYRRDGRHFTATEDPARLAGPGGAWAVGEAALTGPDGTRLPRVAGHISYWFAWDGYLGVQSTLYAPP